tara:strand:- start:29625 stop:30233 length:609 start_codon:yes stop_codon:yes gene_type:complete
MINLSYHYDQNASSLKLTGIPDVSSGDSAKTIGILSSWTLQIIGSPLLEGKKEHLENLMQVVFQYSRSSVSGIRKSFVSSNQIVCISPLDTKHKLLLNSTKKDVKPLTIILDDSELSDLTRCLDLVRFDKRIHINWELQSEHPYTKRYIYRSLNNRNSFLPLAYSFALFATSILVFMFIPIDYNHTLELPIENKSQNMNTSN